MEQSAAFKSVRDTITDLESRLANVNNKEYEQSTKEVEREIEEHFSKCFNALAARKEALLQEVAQKGNDQSMS